MTTEKFKLASEALYQGEQDEAAKLFEGGIAEEVARRAPPAVDTDAIVRAVTDNVRAQPAIDELFEKFPEMRSHKAYAMLTDEKVAEFVATGEPLDVAIRKAGDAVAKEWGLGKGGSRSASRRSASHPTETNDDDGSMEYPATIAGMLDARLGSK